MHILSLLKKITEKTLDVTISRKEPFGSNPISDVLSVKKKITTFFDVGANIGQTALSVQEKIPESTIYCFEPFPGTFLKLEANSTRHKNIVPIQLALGSSNTIFNATEQKEFDSSMNKLTSDDDSKDSIQISIRTLDDYCEEKGIKNIDYLKIDTEGHELEVLKGSEGALQKQEIDFIEVEVGMNPENQYHIPIEVIKKHLEERGYKLFGIYEQVHEWILKKPVLRRVNAVFISDKLSTSLTDNPIGH